ncbi:MAG: hypothetical protein A3J59_01860 [Candidatus Buchananbacteria bacterium RIFCSPHIGHO2_02_FULL_56_16]|uniref:Cell shape-determining protein MreC n=1 Tax=Candidatus Buchananbacteria bacterium RIFCSPHIGHO2_02_FULL_56_16 TaxID=1797542 RepID=A0A1G1YHT0_9BACT|nr:MAG: hypothetical protein A3J59_01860 [Candidatus Buchananbacteria bacterium RIFCSPHIGHO2_02_FULL_56_16]
MRVLGRPVKLVVVLLAAVALLIFLHYTRVLLPVEGLIQTVLTPVEHRLYALGTSINHWYRFPGARDLTEANQQLEGRINALTVENAQLKTLLAEQGLENQQVEFLAAVGLEAINAKVVGRNLETNERTMIANKGSADQVRVGAPVIAERGMLVGRVVAVRTHSAQIRLVNDSLSSFGAMIQNEGEDRGVVVGDRGLSVKMDLIAQGVPVVVGDVVVTSGIETDVPRGLVIGQVDRVVSEPNNLFQQAFIKTLVDIDALVVVSILNPQYDE